jgi:DNA-binding transcriptional ArsR family regulator
MVEYQADDARLDRTFSALSDTTRRAILSRLRTGGLTVGEIAEPFDMSLAAVSKHVRVLEHAGLIRREVRGREHRCSLEPGPLEDASAWTERYRAFWEGRLDALAELLDRRRRAGRDSR